MIQEKYKQFCQIIYKPKYSKCNTDFTIQNNIQLISTTLQAVCGILAHSYNLDCLSFGISQTSDQ